MPANLATYHYEFDSMNPHKSGDTSDHHGGGRPRLGSHRFSPGDQCLSKPLALFCRLFGCLVILAAVPGIAQDRAPLFQPISNPAAPLARDQANKAVKRARLARLDFSQMAQPR